jgi:hypothetical protein
VARISRRGGGKFRENKFKSEHISYRSFKSGKDIIIIYNKELGMEKKLLGRKEGSKERETIRTVLSSTAFNGM